MNYRRAYVLTAAYVAAVVLLSLAAYAVLSPRVAHAVPTASAANHGGYCAEDERCFRWSTMGNLKRGVTLLPTRKHRHGSFRVVDACTFAYLDFRARIDWTRTRTVPGDEYARRHGCDWRKFAPDASVRPRA